LIRGEVAGFLSGFLGKALEASGDFGMRGRENDQVHERQLSRLQTARPAKAVAPRPPVCDDSAH